MEERVARTRNMIPITENIADSPPWWYKHPPKKGPTMKPSNILLTILDKTYVFIFHLLQMMLSTLIVERLNPHDTIFWSGFLLTVECKSCPWLASSWTLLNQWDIQWWWDWSDPEDQEWSVKTQLMWDPGESSFLLVISSDILHWSWCWQTMLESRRWRWCTLLTLTILFSELREWRMEPKIILTS